MIPRWEVGNVCCRSPVRNLRAVTRFPFPISSLVFLPSPLDLSVFFFPANCQFSCLFFVFVFLFVVVFSLQTILHVLLSDKLFCVALVKQVQEQIDGWWYVCAVCCHMALIFVIIHYVVFCVCIVRIYSLFILSLICIVSDISLRYQPVLALIAYFLKYFFKQMPYVWD